MCIGNAGIKKYFLITHIHLLLKNVLENSFDSEDKIWMMGYRCPNGRQRVIFYLTS